MNTNPYQTYRRTQTSALRGRPAEAEAFARAAALLDRAAANPGDGPAYREALGFNRNLWTVVQASLEEPPAVFPDDLRRDILRLSLFVDRQTVTAMAAPSPERLRPLIEIDRNMASGLLAGAA